MNEVITGNRRARGTIIKLPDTTSGLLVVEGQQKPFTLEGIWRAAQAPSAGLTCEIELDAQGAVIAIHETSAQQLALEQGQRAAALSRKAWGTLTSRVGKLSLGAVAVLWLSWFFLPTVKSSFISFTFWELLGVDADNMMSLMRGTSNHGLMALLGLVSIAAPVAAPFVKSRQARWLNAAPLAFLGLLVLKFSYQIYAMQAQAAEARQRLGLADAASSGLGDSLGWLQAFGSKSVVSALWEAIGIGLWLLLLSSVVLFVQAIRGGAGAPIMAAGAGLAALGPSDPLTGTAATVPPPAPRVSSRVLVLVGAGVVALAAVAGAFMLVLRLTRSPGAHAAALTEDLASIAETDRGKCDNFGDDLQSFLDAHRAEFEALPEELRKADSAAFLEKDAPRIQAATLRFGAAGAFCSLHPSVVKTLPALRTAMLALAVTPDAPAKALQPETAATPRVAANVPQATPLPEKPFNPMLPTVPEPARVEPAAATQELSPSEPATTPTPTPAGPQAAPAVPALPSPAAGPIPTTGPIYGVFDVLKSDQLTVRVAPDASANKLLGLAPSATRVLSTGKTTTVGGATWVELALGTQTGWANRAFLVERRDTPCADARLTALAQRFFSALQQKNGTQLAAAVSPVHGLLIRATLDGPSVRVAPSSTSELFASTKVERWSQPGAPSVAGSFADVILPALQASSAASVTQTCGEVVPPSAQQPRALPVELAALVPYSFKAPTTTWVLGIEYVRGAPFVSALIQDPAPGSPATAKTAAVTAPSAPPASAKTAPAPAKAAVAQPEPAPAAALAEPPAPKAKRKRR